MKSFAGIALMSVLIVGGALFAFLYRAWSDKTGSGTESLAALRAENEKLQSQLTLLQAQVCVSDKGSKNVSAAVYAEYPWNGEALLVVNKGSEDGVGKGMPVTTENGFAVGTVTAVRKQTADVLTIFDPSWRSSAAIGAKGVRAVLSGGAVPQLTLIPQDATVGVGDAVVNAASVLPLYTPIGKIDTVELAQDGVWKKASISVPYQEENLRNVLIQTNFP